MALRQVENLLTVFKRNFVRRNRSQESNGLPLRAVWADWAEVREEDAVCGFARFYSDVGFFR
jgi:hypothetical protein